MRIGSRVLAMSGLGLFVVAGCTAQPGQTATPPAPAAEAATLDALPLKRGYYVSTDTACGAASRATLALVRGDGISECGFERSEALGGDRYRVTQVCDEDTGPETVEYRLQGDQHYRMVGEHWESEFRYCPQPSLPEDYRDNDISDL